MARYNVRSRRRREDDQVTLSRQPRHGQALDGFDGPAGGQAFDFGIRAHALHGDHAAAGRQQVPGQIHEIDQLGKRA